MTKNELEALEQETLKMLNLGNRRAKIIAGAFIVGVFIAFGVVLFVSDLVLSMVHVYFQG